MVVVALLSVYLVESVYVVSVYLVVNCITLDVPIPINIAISMAFTFSTATPRGKVVSKKARRKNLPL